MLRNSLLRAVLALGVGMTGASGLSAQAKDSSQTQDTSTVIGDTYTTLDGYGLGRIVSGSLSDVTFRARAAMVKMKIVEESSRPRGQGWTELRGKKGGLDVSIRLKSQGVNSTRVEVNARQGPTGWDKGFEEQVLDAVGKP